MNIIILTREYKHQNLPNVGGTGSFYATLAQKLHYEGHNVFVFGVNKTNVAFDDNGVKVVFKKSIFKRNKLLNLLRSITKKTPFLYNLHFKIHELEKKDISKMLYQFIKNNNLKIDLIETHDFEGISLKLNNSIPYVIRCHGSYSVLEKYFGYKNIEIGKKHCEHEAFKIAKNVICISQFSVFANQTVFNIKNTKLIYNGINTDLFSPNNTAKQIKKSLFFIGNVSFEKGIDIVFETFKNIQKLHLDATLHIIGRCKNFDGLLADYDILNLKQKIFYYGYLGQDDAIAKLGGANIVVFPSKGENFGLALFEAMAIEKIVIGSNIDAFKEIITDGQNGFIASSSKDYATIINSIFDNSTEFEIIKKNARQTIIEHLSLQKMYVETIKYYNQMILEQ